MLESHPHNTSHSIEDDSQKQAYSYALRLLARQDYSEHKIKSKLLQKGYSQATGQEVISRLVDQGLLNERAYATARVQALMKKGHPPTFIIQKLAQEKVVVSSDFIGQIFEEHGVTTSGQLCKLITKKIRPHDHDATQLTGKLRDKIIRYSLSKGHSLDDILKAIKSYNCATIND